eukprot:551520_1
MTKRMCIFMLSIVLMLQANGMLSKPSIEEIQTRQRIESKLSLLERNLQATEYYMNEAITLLSLTYLSSDTPKYMLTISSTTTIPLMSHITANTIRLQIINQITSSIPQISKLSIIILPKISDIILKLYIYKKLGN